MECSVGSRNVTPSTIWNTQGTRRFLVPCNLALMATLAISRARTVTTLPTNHAALAARQSKNEKGNERSNSWRKRRMVGMCNLPHAMPHCMQNFTKEGPQVGLSRTTRDFQERTPGLVVLSSTENPSRYCDYYPYIQNLR